MAQKLLTCDCLGSQKIDAAALSKATGLNVAPPCTALCTTQIEIAAKGLQDGAAIACAQETRRFEALAAELELEPPQTLDLRDRAGWSADAADKTPKMAALIAEAALPAPPSHTRDVISEGLCLIIGSGAPAIQAAQDLAPYLSVTLLLPPQTQPEDIPAPGAFDTVLGQLRSARGALGGFEVTIDALSQPEPGGAGTPAVSTPKDGGRSACDIILDITGNPPLFSAHEKREGYLRADPGHAPSLAAATMAASHLVGTFEKPLYVKMEAILCAHSRAEQTGCTRCLVLCPTGAITPAGEHVSVDPMICAGCGACAAACPSGAISYDAPAQSDTTNRLQTLAQSYLSAGGTAPRLLVTGTHGSEMISLAARHGDGLPADVIPFEAAAPGAVGHAEILAALAAGFASVTLVPNPGTDTEAWANQTTLAATIAGHDCVHLLDEADPDALCAALFAETAPAPIETPTRPMGTRRQITRSAARALQGTEAQIPLPQGAPYGAVLVNTDACTLCLSCVSLCPSGALGDNPDLPQLRFQEDACLQCGLCASICPEDAITYEPRLNLSDSAISQVILNEEEPFACIECGVLFGSKSTVERITEKLTGHPMFSDPAKLAAIQMCDNCRVNAQFHSDDNPFAGGERPKQFTTQDELSKRRDH